MDSVLVKYRPFIIILASFAFTVAAAGGAPAETDEVDPIVGLVIVEDESVGFSDVAGHTGATDIPGELPPPGPDSRVVAHDLAWRLVLEHVEDLVDVRVQGNFLAALLAGPV